MVECQNILSLIKRLEPGCYPGMCGNKNILKQIQQLTFNLEQKMFALKLVFKFEGRNCIKEITRTRVKYSVPGSNPKHPNNRPNGNRSKSHQGIH